MTRLGFAAALLTGLVCLNVAHAQDKADPSGTWKWSAMFGKNKTAMEQSVKLKLDGEKLTGSMSGRNGQEVAIEEGSFKEGTVSFKVTSERNGQKFTARYSGKLKGDTITGKTEIERNDKKQSVDWEAKRST